MSSGVSQELINEAISAFGSWEVNPDGMVHKYFREPGIAKGVADALGGTIKHEVSSPERSDFLITVDRDVLEEYAAQHEIDVTIFEPPSRGGGGMGR